MMTGHDMIVTDDTDEESPPATQTRTTDSV